MRYLNNEEVHEAITNIRDAYLRLDPNGEHHNGVVLQAVTKAVSERLGNTYDAENLSMVIDYAAGVLEDPSHVESMLAHCQAQYGTEVQCAFEAFSDVQYVIRNMPTLEEENVEPALYMVIAGFADSERFNLEVVDYNLSMADAEECLADLARLNRDHQAEQGDEDCDLFDHEPKIVKQGERIR